MSAAGLPFGAAAIRALRPPRRTVDPWRALAVLEEVERGLDGRTESVVTLFLAGAECPFSCVYCDLWQSTLEGPTPPGALQRQIVQALAALGEEAARARVVKLYNASNFFDPRAVPDDDIDSILEAVGSFERLVVESHPRLIGRRAREVVAVFPGRLEVAMGLETVHPVALEHIEKEMTLSDFDRAVDQLRDWQADVRAFVLVGVPFVPPEAQLEWAVRSVEHAARIGVARTTLIPVRGGNGALELLAERGEWTAPSLDLLEATLEAALGVPGVLVSVDTWDLERLAECPDCAPGRIARLSAANLSGVAVEGAPCPSCGWPGRGAG